MEFAGEVEAVGAAVTEFEVGDHVFGVKGTGAHAEFTCVRESGPIAAQARRAELRGGRRRYPTASSSRSPACGRPTSRPGRSILIYGASGSIGTAAVQLARHFEADVTAVCTTKNVELVRSLGADEVIDYLREDFTKNGRTYDVVFDAVGKLSFRRGRGSLNPGGVFIETDLGFMWHVPPLALATRWIGDKRVTIPLPTYSKENVLLLKELVDAGRFRPVIDRTYPLEDVVEATRYVETEQKTGERRPDRLSGRGVPPTRSSRCRPPPCRSPGGCRP